MYNDSPTLMDTLIVSNRSDLNKLHKLELALSGQIKCGYCRYHKNENKTNHERGDKYKNKVRLTERKIK